MNPDQDRNNGDLCTCRYGGVFSDSARFVNRECVAVHDESDRAQGYVGPRGVLMRTSEIGMLLTDAEVRRMYIARDIAIESASRAAIRISSLGVLAKNVESVSIILDEMLKTVSGVERDAISRLSQTAAILAVDLANLDRFQNTSGKCDGTGRPPVCGFGGLCRHGKP